MLETSSSCGAGGPVEVELTLPLTPALFGDEGCSGTVEPSGACGWTFDIDCPHPDNSTTLVGTIEARASGPSGEFEATNVGFTGMPCTTRARLVGLVPIDR